MTKQEHEEAIQAIKDFVDIVREQDGEKAAEDTLKSVQRLLDSTPEEFERAMLYAKTKWEKKHAFI